MSYLNDDEVYDESEINEGCKVGDLRIWWMRNMSETYYYDVANEDEAIAKIEELTELDLREDSGVTDNAGGVNEFDSEGEWCSYYNPEGIEIDEMIDVKDALTSNFKNALKAIKNGKIGVIDAIVDSFTDEQEDEADIRDLADSIINEEDFIIGHKNDEQSINRRIRLFNEFVEICKIGQFFKVISI